MTWFRKFRFLLQL